MSVLSVSFMKRQGDVCVYTADVSINRTKDHLFSHAAIKKVCFTSDRRDWTAAAVLRVNLDDRSKKDD